MALSKPRRDSVLSPLETSTPTQPSVARMYDYYLGGTHNTAIDRAAVDAVAKAMPDCFALCLENRSFLRRAVRYMLSQGITQFIDIGSGLPTNSNTHDVAQAINPGVKVVYVDMDPSVLDHGRRLLEGNGLTSVVLGDIRKTEKVLWDPEVTRLIDFGRPVGVLMMCVACFFTDGEIGQIMRDIRGRIAEGSFVAASHDTFDGKRGQGETVRRVQEVYKDTPIPIYFRSRKEFLPLFEGLELVEPGVVFLDEWHVALDLPASVASRWLYGGVGKKVSNMKHLNVVDGDVEAQLEEKKVVSKWSLTGALWSFEQRVQQNHSFAEDLLLLSVKWLRS